MSSIKKNENLSFIKIVQDYFERMLQEIIGIKCLILDEETTGSYLFKFPIFFFRHNLCHMFPIPNIKERRISDRKNPQAIKRAIAASEGDILRSSHSREPRNNPFKHQETPFFRVLPL